MGSLTVCRVVLGVQSSEGMVISSYHEMASAYLTDMALGHRHAASSCAFLEGRDDDQ